jgi:hypothetical protein
VIAAACTARTPYDWSALTAHRRDPQAAEPAGWAAALEHLDACPGCRRAALAADPTLLFRRLAAPEPGLGGDADVALMRQGVAALRAAGRVAPEMTSAAGLERRRAGGTWKRWVAAAALALAAFSAGRDQAPERTAAVVDGVSGAGRPAAAVQPARLQLMPLVEGLDRPNARVYQMQEEDLSVAMIVDEGLEI